MIKNKLFKTLACVVSASCLLATTSALTVSADEENTNTNSQIFVLNEEENGQPPVWYGDDGVMPCGANIPASSAVVNLSNNSPFIANISSFKHRVYTNVMFTGVSGMVVSITGGAISEYLNGDHTRRINLSVYKYNASSDDDLVISDTIDYRYDMDLVDCYPLDPYSKYYVRVDKTQDGIYLYNIDIHLNQTC